MVQSLSTRPQSSSMLTSLVPQPEQEREASGVQPHISRKERAGGENQSLHPADDPNILPLDPAVGQGPEPTVAVLEVVARVVVAPRLVPSWLDEVTEGRLHEHGLGIRPPRAGEVRLDGELLGEELLLRDDLAVVDDEPRGLEPHVTALGSDGVGLAGAGLGGDDEGVMDEG